MKDNQMVKPTIDLDGGCILFEVRNKTPLRLDMSKVHPDVARRAAFVGMAQVRIVDAAAISRQAPDGHIRSAGEMADLKHLAMAALIEHYESGSPEWVRPRGAGGARDTTGLVVAAMIRVMGIDAVEAERRIEALAEKRGIDPAGARKLFGETSQVALAILDIKRERLAPGPSADDLLDELVG